MMRGFRWRHQRDIVREFEDKYFQEVREVFKTTGKEYSFAFGRDLFPFFPDDETILKKTEELFASVASDEIRIIHFLKEQLDDLRRAKACRDLDRKKK